MAIKVNASTGVGGFVTPGDEVDIVLTRGPVCSPDWMNKYIFPRYEEYWGLLRDVTPEQGQKLALAQRAGTLSLLLRSLETEEDAPLEAVHLSDLLLDKSPSEGEVKSVVRVRRGANEITEQVVN